MVLSLVADLAAIAWALAILWRLRDGRLAFLGVLPALLAVHQVLLALPLPPAPLARDLGWGVQATGLGASLFALLAVISAGRSLVERHRSQRELQIEKAQLERLFNSSAEAVVLLDNEDRVLQVNPMFEELFGYGAAEADGRYINDLIAPEGTQGEASSLTERVARGETVHVEAVRRRKDGSPVQVSILGTPIHTDVGQVAIYGIYRDITERKRAEEALRASEERYALAARGAGAGLWDWDLVANEIYYSPRWKELLGYGDEEVGSTPSEWLSRVHPEDRAGLERSLARHLEGGSPHFEDEHRILHRNGTYPWMLVRGMAVRDADGRPCRLAGSLTEVTERRLAEEQLRRAALHDALTGLPNRSLFTEILDRAFRRGEKERGYGFAVLFLDIDRFKLVNDSLGHLAGDRVLRAVGGRLQASLRAGDVVARLGGDEFILFLDGVTHEELATSIAQRILADLAAPIEIEGQDVVLSAGIGIVLSDPAYEAPDDLLRDADIAMYRTKIEGGGACRVFDPAMHAEVVARLQLETDLRRAMERGELAVHYQPVVMVATGRIAGFEALVRWVHPERGLVLPAEFIATAEETGLIVELGDQVLRTACARLALFQERSGADHRLFMSVNLSARQFRQPDLAGRVDGAVRAAGIDPSQLNLEITESALMEGSERHVGVVRELRDLGVNVHIDDFGTGYSSLSYLHQFAIQALKIDRSFIRHMDDGRGNREIVESILTLAANLEIGVIAEGVETEAQRLLLARLRCPMAQGFLFSRPVEGAEAERLLPGRWGGPRLVQEGAKGA